MTRTFSRIFMYKEYIITNDWICWKRIWSLRNYEFQGLAVDCWMWDIGWSSSSSYRMFCDLRAIQRLRQKRNWIFSFLIDDDDDSYVSFVVIGNSKKKIGYCEIPARKERPSHIILNEMVFLKAFVVSLSLFSIWIPSCYIHIFV